LGCGLRPAPGTISPLREFKGKVGQSPASLQQCLEFDKDLNLRVERLYQYASLRVSEDASDAANLKREAELQNLFTKIAEASSFISPEIQAIDDPTFDSFLAHPLLSGWQITLRKNPPPPPHTLSEPEERILALGASTIGGHHETFSQLTNVDMKFGLIADEERRRAHPLPELLQLLHGQARPALRKTAFHQFYAEFRDHAYTLASSLAHSVRGDVFSARAAIIPPPATPPSFATMSAGRL